MPTDTELALLGAVAILNEALLTTGIAKAPALADALQMQADDLRLRGRHDGADALEFHLIRPLRSPERQQQRALIAAKPTGEPSN